MKSFKQFISEKVDFGNPELVASFPDLIKGGQELGTYSGAVSGLDPVTFPVMNYRSAALTPDAQSGQNDPFVSGGQGWKIDKNSKDFFTKIAKMYGIGNVDNSQKQKEIQQKQQQEKSNINKERLVFDYITNPLMSELLNHEKSKDILKAAAEMQSWKSDFQNPMKRLESWYPKTTDAIIANHKKDTEMKDSSNLTKQTNALRQRTIATDLFDKAYQLNIAPKDNPHIRDFTDPIQIKMDMVDQMLKSFEYEDIEKEGSHFTDDPISGETEDDGERETFDTSSGMEF